MITAIFENNQLVSYSLKTWQYDYGQILRIEGLNLPTAVEIHFSLTEKGGESVTRVGMTKDGVTDVVIPDSFLENNDITQDYQIYAFIYLRDDTSGQTEYKIPISVTSRPKPEAFNRPEDGEIFKEAIQAVRESADQAAESARQAESIKESVQNMVDTIGSIDEQVQAVKEFAQKAETASSNAALSESRAKESETAAETAKESAETAAESAIQSSTAVEQAVSGFDGKVVEANIAIESAKTRAVKAVEDKGNEVLQSIPPDFETQMASKLDKQQGAENKGKALVVGEDGNVTVGEAAGGDGIPIINTMSGESPLVVPDSAERVNKGFELSGNTEQVSTKGLNLFNYKDFVDVNTYQDKGFAYRRKYLQLKPNTSYHITIFKNKMTGSLDRNVMFIGDKETYDNTSANGTIVFFTSNEKKSATITTKESGQIVFKLNANSMSESQEEYLSQADIIFSEGTTEIPYEPYTGGKPSPSPDYPQEIKNVGKWNEEKQKYEVDAKVTGKNLFDKEKAKNIDSWVPSSQDGKSGYLDFPIYVGKGNKFTVSIKPPTEKVPELYLCFAVKKYGANAGWLYHATSTFNPAQTKIAEEDYIFLRCIKPKVADLMNIVKEIQVELSLVQTSYEPYKEQTLTLTSDRPITKWDKLVERDGQIGWLYGTEKITLNGNERWVAYSDFSSFYTIDYDIQSLPNPYCSYYMYGSVVDDNQDKIFAIGVGQYYNSLWIKDKRFNMSLQDFNLYLSESYKNGKPVTILYGSKNPTFRPLPQSEQSAIRALKTYYPTTVITADGGEVDPNIEVTYTADTKNYIDQKIEAINKAIVTTQKALL